MDYATKPTIEYNLQQQTLSGTPQKHPNGLELLAKSPTRLKEPGQEGIQYRIDGCECPCPCACITFIEGSIIKGTITGTVFTGASVL